MSDESEKAAQRLAELWYHADGFTDMAEAGTLPDPIPWIADALVAEHSGDCQKQSWPCMRCHAEEIMPVARWVNARLEKTS